MDEIRMVPQSSDPVDKSKSSCLLRFRSMLGKDEWRQRCSYKMGRSGGRIQNVLFLQGIAGNRWRINRIRVEYFFQNFRHCRFFNRSRMICKNGTLNLKNSQIGSSSCQCSTMLIGQEKETNRFVFRIQKKVNTYAKKFSQGHEKKWYGKSKYLAGEKWNSVASQMVQRFQETGYPVIARASALSRGILRTLKGKTMHFNAGVLKNTELLFRIIHSVKQLSIYGALHTWCEQFG